MRFKRVDSYNIIATMVSSPIIMDFNIPGLEHLMILRPLILLQFSKASLNSVYVAQTLPPRYSDNP